MKEKDRKKLPDHPDKWKNYHVLNVNVDATEEEIKSSYKRLALMFHPDKNIGNAEAEQKFKQVATAYKVLIDPESRRRYDLLGQAECPTETNPMENKIEVREGQVLRDWGLFFVAFTVFGTVDYILDFSTELVITAIASVYLLYYAEIPLGHAVLITFLDILGCIILPHAWMTTLGFFTLACLGVLLQNRDIIQIDRSVLAVLFSAVAIYYRPDLSHSSVGTFCGTNAFLAILYAGYYFREYSLKRFPLLYILPSTILSYHSYFEPTALYLFWSPIWFCNTLSQRVFSHYHLLSHLEWIPLALVWICIWFEDVLTLNFRKLGKNFCIVILPAVALVSFLPVPIVEGAVVLVVHSCLLWILIKWGRQLTERLTSNNAKKSDENLVAYSPPVVLRIVQIFYLASLIASDLYLNHFQFLLSFNNDRTTANPEEVKPKKWKKSRMEEKNVLDAGFHISLVFGLITSYFLVMHCLEQLPSPLFKTYREFYSKIVDWFQYQVSLNKDDKVKGGGGMWSGPPVTVHLDGTAKGKVKEKTDIDYKSAREMRREKEREAAKEAKKAERYASKHTKK